jgi:hypothetical protein
MLSFGGQTAASSAFARKTGRHLIDARFSRPGIRNVNLGVCKTSCTLRETAAAVQAMHGSVGLRASFQFASELDLPVFPDRKNENGGECQAAPSPGALPGLTVSFRDTGTEMACFTAIRS